VSAKKRDDALFGPLASIAEYGITFAANEPAQFVRNLSRKWIDRGGQIAGKPRHSDRYLKDLLEWRGTPVQSLTAKLAGDLDFTPDDANALVQLFLSYWHYVGDRSESKGDGTPSIYRPMISNGEVIEVASYVGGRISEYGVEGDGDVVLPGQNMGRLIANEFVNSNAVFVVSPRRTVITAQPRQVLLGFRNLMNRLWQIDEGDQKKRILVWVLDLGRQEFEDGFRFLNVQELRSRFKALRLFKERDTEARWNWLRSKAAIVMYEPKSEAHEGGRPTFAAHHALLSRVPSSWVGLRQIQMLCGSNFERLNETTFSVFLRRLVDSASKDTLSNVEGCYEVRYFGHALFAPPHSPSDREARGLKLPSPGESYEDAFRVVYAAAAEILRSTDAESINGKGAIDKLRRLGFRLMSLEEFMEDL
jgi:hypothetical protein